MPLRGESVGTAYIRLIADGTGIPDDIRDAFNDVDEHQIEDVGQKHTKAYKKGVKEELENSKDLNLGAVFERALGKNKGTNKFFAKSAFWKNFKNDVDEAFEGEFRGVARLAVESLEDEFRRKGTLTGIDNAVEAFIPRMQRLRDELAKAKTKASQDAEKAARDFEKNFRKIMDETDERYLESKKVSLEVNEAIRRSYEDLGSTFRAFGRSHDSLISKGIALTKRLKANNAAADDSANVFGRLSIVIDHIADKTGRAFGKGSRNDFINFTGSFVAGATSLLGLLPKLLDNVTQFGSGFKTALAEGTGFFKAMSSGFSEMSKSAEGASTSLSASFSSIVIAAPAIVLALLGVVQILGAVAALASGVAAALTAMVSTISFAIIGGIAPLIGVLGPLAAIIGVGVVTAVGIAQGKFEKMVPIIKAVKDEFKGLSDIAATGFMKNLAVDAGQVHDIFDTITPVVRSVSIELGKVATAAAENLSATDGPFAKWLDLLSVQAPRQLHVLSQAFGGFAEGIAGIFRSLRKPVAEFDGWLRDLGQRFSRFANSPGGQRKLKDFFEEASESAKVLGDFIREASRLIGELLVQGRGTGNDIFSSLTENIKKFTDSLKSTGGETVFDEAIGGQKRFARQAPVKNPLADFFKNGKQVADDLGKIAVAFGKVFDELDRPESREFLHNALSATLKFVDALIFLIGIANSVTDAFIQFGKMMGTWFELFKRQTELGIGAVQRLGEFIHGLDFRIKLPDFGKIAGAIGKFFSSLGGSGGGRTLQIKPPSLAWIPNVVGRISGMIGNIIGIMGRLISPWSSTFTTMVGRVRDAAVNVIQALGSIPSRLGNLAARFGAQAAAWGRSIISEIEKIPGQILNIFAGLGSAISNVIGSIHIDWPDPPAWLSKLVGGGTNAFSELTGIGNNASGTITNGPQLSWIGEAGREAIVPLDIPLSQVDPSVRWLAALARGQGGTAVAVAATPSKTVNVTQTINSPTTDVIGLARETVNQLVATAY